MAAPAGHGDGESTAVERPPLTQHGDDCRRSRRFESRSFEPVHLRLPLWQLKTLEIPFNVPETSSPRPARSPRQTGTKASTAAGLSQPLLAQKLLPIRTSSSIDPEVDNPKVGKHRMAKPSEARQARTVAPNHKAIH